jgi:hypothetical protein
MEEHLANWLTPKKVIKETSRTNHLSAKCDNNIFRIFDLPQKREIYTLLTIGEDALLNILSFDTLELLNLRYTCKSMKLKYESVLRVSRKDSYKSNPVYMVSSSYIYMPASIPRIKFFHISLSQGSNIISSNIEFSSVDLLDNDNWYINTDCFPVDQEVLLSGKLTIVDSGDIQIRIRPSFFKAVDFECNIPLENSEVLGHGSLPIYYNNSFVPIRFVSVFKNIKTSYPISRSSPQGRHGRLRDIRYYFERL